jgi:hypothetical protein
LFEAQGIERVAFSIYPHRALTKVGMLGVHATASDIGLTVFCRFDEPERAIAILGRDAVNPYSGKWNHHFGDAFTVDEAVKHFEWQFGRVRSRCATALLGCRRERRPNDRRTYRQEGESMKVTITVENDNEAAKLIQGLNHLAHIENDGCDEPPDEYWLFRRVREEIEQAFPQVHTH